MTLFRRYARCAGGSLIAAVIGQALPLVVAAVLARVLPVQSYGAFLFLYGTASTFASLTGYSLGLTATRYVALLYATAPARAGVVIVQSIRMTLQLSGAVAVLATAGYSMFGGSANKSTVVSAGVLFFALSLTGVQSGVLAGLQSFPEIARGNLIRMLLGLPLAVAAALRFGAGGALAGIAIATVAGCVVNRLQIARVCRARDIDLNWRSSAREPGMWTQFSVPSFLAYALVMPVLWLGQAVLLSVPDGLHEVAVFNIAQHWRNVIVFVPAAMIQAATPLMAELLGCEDRASSNRLFYFNLAGSGLIALTCAATIAVLGKFILSVYGAPYLSSWPVLVMSAAAAVLITINNALGAIIVAAGRMWAGCLLNLLWAVAVLAQAVPLSHRMGALGLSIAVLIAYILHSGWQSAYVIRARLVPSTVLEHAV